MTQATVAITGNTYPVKDQIKALGGRWNAEAKAWMVPADKADQARALVPSAPAKKSSGGERAYSYTRRDASRGGYFRGASRSGGDRCACGCGARLTDFDRRSSSVPAYTYDCA